MSHSRDPLFKSRRASPMRARGLGTRHVTPTGLVYHSVRQKRVAPRRIAAPGTAWLVFTDSQIPPNRPEVCKHGGEKTVVAESPHLCEGKHDALPMAVCARARACACAFARPHARVAVCDVT